LKKQGSRFKTFFNNKQKRRLRHSI